MTGYLATTAAVSAFLGIVVLEALVVIVWRWLEAHDFVAHPPMLEGVERVQTRRSMMFWLAVALLFEGSHDLLRSGYYVFRLGAWPFALSFWLTFGEGVAVLGLIRAFTRHVCGEWGWTLACVLPIAVSIGVLMR